MSDDEFYFNNLQMVAKLYIFRYSAKTATQQQQQQQKNTFYSKIIDNVCNNIGILFVIT